VKDRRMDTASTSNGSTTVVVGVDGSASSDTAVEYAAKHAAAHHLPLRIVHGAGAPVVTDFGYDLESAQQGLRLHAADVVEAAAELAREHGPGLVISELVELDDPRNVLLRAAAEASVVVLGSRGHGTVAGLLLGSVGVALSAHAPCPVVIARPGPVSDDTRLPVVVGVDGTAASAGAIAAAFGLASWQQRPLEIVHALGDPRNFPYFDVLSDQQVSEVRTEAKLRVAESVAGSAERYPDVKTSLSVVLDSPARALRTASETAYAVVVGSRGRGPVARRLLGSVSRSVVEHAACTVAVVPGP
jgi:nucleotide-binding universal stress UspA family protein